MLKKKLGLEVIENGRWKWGCSYFKIPSTLVIPDGCRRISRSVFENCTNLKEVVISEGVKRIGNSAFWCCRNLEKVEIPGSVEKIGEYAFYKCSNATITVMNKSSENDFKFYDSRAFMDCKKVKYVKEEVRT